VEFQFSKAFKKTCWDGYNNLEVANVGRKEKQVLAISGMSHNSSINDKYHIQEDFKQDIQNGWEKKHEDNIYKIRAERITRGPNIMEIICFNCGNKGHIA
jgi:hypothetical protein